MSELHDLVSRICDEYKGYMKFARLIKLVERIAKYYNYKAHDDVAKLIQSTLFKIYEMGIEDGMVGACEEAVSLAESLNFKAEELGISLETIASSSETFRSKVEAKKMEIEKAKKSQKKDIVRIEYFNLGDIYFENGFMVKAAESYRISYCFSVNADDLIKVSIKLGIVSLYNQNYAFGIKFVREAVFKNLENPKSNETTNLLNTIQALLYAGNGNLNELASCLWESPICSPEELAILSTEKEMAFYAIIAGLKNYSRKKFKDDYYSKPYFRILLENFPDMLELGSTYINFDFDKYFNLLNAFTIEFKHDFYLFTQLNQIVQKCKSKVMITYIIPYKTVDLKEMAESFGMSLEDTERAVEELIVTGEISARIDSFNQILYTKKANVKLDSFKKAAKVGQDFIRGMESMMLKYHLRKKHSVI